MSVIIQHLASASSALPTDASTLEASISALKSSISALESSLKTSEGSSGRWETLAWSCAFAVGIGIVGELVVIISEYRDDLHDWRRGAVFWVWGKVCPPDRPPQWRFWFDIVATVLVLVGVFGEAGASMQLASINSQLRSTTSLLRAKSDQLLALVTLEAGSAASSAERANVAAGKAQKTVEVVSKEAVALERRGTLLMEPKVRTRFKSHIAAFKGQLFDLSTCRMRESEIAYFNMAVWSTLEGDGAGWKLGKDEETGSCQSGVIVFIDTKALEHTRLAARALLDAFKECGFAPPGSLVGTISPPPPNAGEPGVWYLAASQPDAVVVIIGTHP